jgi:hypothetical protein
MLVPKFWASSKLRHRADKKQVTLQRWGWSDESVEHAQRHADERVRAAMDHLLETWPNVALAKSEPKVAYNGAQGVPIREEIVDQQGPDVMTRNGYGALCLNTPDVMFVDIDEEWISRPPPTKWWPRLFLAGVIALIWGLVWASSWPSALDPYARCAGIPGPLDYLGVGLRGLWAWIWRTIAVLVVLHWIHRGRWALFVMRQGGLMGMARNTLKTHSHDGHWAIYKTPKGARLLALHRTFDPSSEETGQLMKDLWADPIYVAMCRRQGCFRARVSAKPWRIPGVDRMRGPVWPVEGDALDRRINWVKDYDAVQSGFAACALIEVVGNPDALDPRADTVRRWHDQMSQSSSGKPLA